MLTLLHAPSTAGGTGEYSVYTTHKGKEIMFHVGPFLPYKEADPQQLAKKRHIGNDVVVIVFMDGQGRFDPLQVKSQFNRMLPRIPLLVLAAL